MIKKIVGALVFSFWASSAYSLIDAEAMYGMRWFKTKDASDTNFHTSGQSYSLGVNLDPLPMIPVSVGANYTIVELNKSDFGAPNTARIDELGIDVKVWAKMFPWVTPYLRGRYVASSKLKVKYDNNPANNIDSKLTGFHLNIGIEYRIIPLLHVLLEAGQAFEKISDFGNGKQNFDSTGVMLGLQVGI